MQIFSKLYIQVNNSRIPSIKNVEFLEYFLHEKKHVKGDFQIWNSVLSAFKSLLQILMKVTEKSLWRSYNSIVGIYNLNEDVWSWAMLHWKTLKSWLKSLKLILWQQGSQMKWDFINGFWQKIYSQWFFVICYYLINFQIIANNSFISFNELMNIH